MHAGKGFQPPLAPVCQTVKKRSSWEFSFQNGLLNNKNTYLHKHYNIVPMNSWTHEEFKINSIKTLVSKLRRTDSGPEHHPPQKKVKKCGPTCGEGGLACWNCKICKIKDLFGEVWNFLGNLGRKLVLRKILRKEKVFEGALQWKGAQFF
jgi:hypothetical protein